LLVRKLVSRLYVQSSNGMSSWVQCGLMSKD
jgi:hypothetical protein